MGLFSKKCKKCEECDSNCAGYQIIMDVEMSLSNEIRTLKKEIENLKKNQKKEKQVKKGKSND